MTKSYHYIFGILVIIVILLLFSFAPRSCSASEGELEGETGGDTGSGSSSGDATISELYLNKVQLDLVVEEQEQLTVSVVMSDGSDYIGSYKWSSSSEDVAFVDQSGLVTALSEGTSYVQVTVDDGQYAICVVNVTEYDDPNLGGEGGEPGSGDSGSGKSGSEEGGSGIQPQDVFKASFPNTDKYFYRVGNSNKVELSYIFDVIEGYEHLIDDVEIAYSAVEEQSDVAVKYDRNRQDWTKGTLDFSGTGLICLTISAYTTEEEYEELFEDYSIRYFDDNENDLNGEAPEGDVLLNSFDLYLEVENGGNAFSTSDLGGRSSECDVMLCDITVSSFNSFTYSGNSRLFGNGFTLTIDATSVNSTGVINLTDNARMDHLSLIVKDHNNVYGHSDEIMFNDAVDVGGSNITISNCYIQGGRAAVRTRAKNLTIRDSVINGGAYANILVSDTCNLTLDNVVTNQYVVGDNPGVMGFGVLLEDNGEGSVITLIDDFKQYNWVTESEAETYFNYSYERYGTSLESLFDRANNGDHEIEEEGELELNTGILGLEMTGDGFTLDQSQLSSDIVYSEFDVVSSLLTGWTVDTTQTERIFTDYVYDESEIHDYGVVEPTFDFNIDSDYSDENITFFYNEDNDLLTLTIDSLGTYTWIPNPIITKYGFTLDAKVYFDDDLDITETGYTFTSSDEGNHTITYTYTDPFNYKHGEDQSIVIYPLTYTQTLNMVVVVETNDTKHATFKYTDVNGNGYPTTIVNIGPKKYVSIDTESDYFDPSSDIAEYAVYDDETEEYVTLYVPKEEAVFYQSFWDILMSSFYYVWPLFTTITISDIEGGIDGGKELSYSTKTTDTSLFSFGEQTKFDILTESDFHWSSNYTDSVCTIEVVNSLLSIKSNELNYKRNAAYPENEFVGEFTYMDEAGQLYYYGIDYHQAYYKYGS